MITRRGLMAGAALAGVVPVLPALGATAEAPQPWRSPQRNLAILLENIRAASPKLAMPEDIITATWDAMVAPRLIPTEVQRGVIEGGLLGAKLNGRWLPFRKRPLSWRYTFELAYDGCMACGNSTRYSHEPARCDAVKRKILDESYVMTLAREIDDLALMVPMAYAQPLEVQVPATAEALWEVIVKTARLRGSQWAAIPTGAPLSLAPGRHDPGLDVVRIPELRGRDVLIGRYDASDAMIWSPHVLTTSAAPLVDSMTFEPYLSSAHTYTWFVNPEKARQAFTRLHCA